MVARESLQKNVNSALAGIDPVALESAEVGQLNHRFGGPVAMFQRDICEGGRGRYGLRLIAA